MTSKKQYERTELVGQCGVLVPNNPSFGFEYIRLMIGPLSVFLGASGGGLGQVPGRISDVFGAANCEIQVTSFIRVICHVLFDQIRWYCMLL